MRGYLQPARKAVTTETQERFATLSRHRRTKLAKVAQTTLLKADQWARGADISADLASALEKALASLKPKK